MIVRMYRHPSEVHASRGEMEVSVVGHVTEESNPIVSFEESGLPNFVLKQFSAEGYERPTAIQAQGWPIALSGKNMVGIARTGSGKTLAVSSFAEFLRNDSNFNNLGVSA